jgi:hypothetical protein
MKLYRMMCAMLFAEQVIAVTLVLLRRSFGTEGHLPCVKEI